MMGIVFMVTMIGSAWSQAGAGSTVGNGGGSLVCNTGEVFLYDLYEATIPGEMSEKGLNIVRSTKPVEAQIEEAFERVYGIVPSLAELFFISYVELKKVVRDIPAGYSLVVPTDVNNDFIKSGCEVKGVARYNSEKNVLFIDRVLMAKMSPTDQAALWIHEAVYKTLRKTQKAQDSRSTRKIVGYLFSDTPATQVPRLTTQNLGPMTSPLDQNFWYTSNISDEVSIGALADDNNEKACEMAVKAFLTYADVGPLEGGRIWLDGGEMFSIHLDPIVGRSKQIHIALYLRDSATLRENSKCLYHIVVWDSSLVEVARVSLSIKPGVFSSKKTLFFEEKRQQSDIK